MKKKLIALTLAFAVFAQGVVLAKSFAVQTQAAENTEAIQLSKTISEGADENGEYTIALESYTTGAVTMGQAGNPVDIVLVLDQSSSMSDDFNGNYTRNPLEQKQYALKNAVTHFVDDVHENGKKYDLNHRIAVVLFSSTYDSFGGFVDVQKNKGYTQIKEGIDALPYSLSGQTFTNLGMDYALSFFTDPNYNPSAEVRDKVVIAFSDGQPTSRLYADWAIEAAYDLKNAEKAEIYTIGTFAGADPSVISGAATAAVDETWPVASDHEDDDDDEDSDVANRFMNYLSSNAKKAQDLGVKFFKKEGQHYCKIKNEYTWKNKGYYLTANDAESLEQIFDDVSHGITIDAPSLGATGQLKDFLSPYFAFPDGFTSSAITLQTAACTGVDANGAYQWAAPTALPAESGVTAQYHPETQSITVTGFDYAANVVTETAKNEAGTDFGQKLMVSFSVKAKDGFLGGNDVVSNKDTSGIYTEQDEPLKKFDVPDTDVVLSTVPITTIDHSIYLGNVVNSGDAVALASSPFDGVNNAYVNTDFSIYWDENGNGIIDEPERAHSETIQIPAGSVAGELVFSKLLAPETNAHYLVEETLTPIYGGTQQPRAEIAGDFFIYPLAPNVAVQDVWVDYGVPVTLSQYCVQQAFWQYVEPVPSNAPAPTAEVPAVRLQSSPEVADDIYPATSEKTFTVQTLQWESTDGNHTPVTLPLAQEAQSEFTVHLNRCNLTLNKTVDPKSQAFYPQPFFFTAQQGAQAFCVGMTAQELESGVCSKSILGLYAGQTITVTEDSAWAWRYVTDNLPATVLHQNLAEDGVSPLISTEPMPVGELTLAINNTLGSPYWLGTEQTVVNRFDGEGDCR